MLVSPVLILLAVGLYGLVHSILASLPAKAWTEQRFAAFSTRYYRISYNFFAVVGLLPVMALVVLLPDRTLYRIPTPWAWLAIAGQGLALLALAIGLLQTGAGSFLGIEQLSRTAPRRESLVTDGLYTWVRHPLYTAGLALIWLTPVMTLNLLAFFAGLTAYLVIGMVFEERKLLREFGATYAEYRSRTPALFPRWKPGKRHTPNQIISDE
jgi:protein-S-isoprenylcysteine O-methyltransferase Ste14